MKSIAGKSVEQDQSPAAFQMSTLTIKNWNGCLKLWPAVDNFIAEPRMLLDAVYSETRNWTSRPLNPKLQKKVSLCQVAVFLSNSSKCGPLLNIYATVASFEVLHALTELWVEKRLPFSTKECGQTSCSSRHIPNIEPRWPKCKGKNHPCFRHFFLGDTPRKISIDTDISLQLPVLTWAGIVRNRCFWRAVFQVMPWDCKLRTLLSKQTCIGWW
jgi:hypothetical protein